MRPREYLDTLPSEALKKQPVEPRLKRWVLLDGNRWVIAAGLLAGVFLSFFAIGRFGIIAVDQSDPVIQLIHVMMVGNFTVIGLVITINQLILSWEFSSPDALRDRVAGVKRFRQDVEELANTAVSPANPTDFLRLIIVSIRERAGTIEETTAHTDARLSEGDRTDPELRERVDAYLKTVTEYTDQMEEILERTQFGTFNALSAMLNYNDAWQIHAARQIRHEHAEELPDGAVEAFEELIEILELFGIARGYFKTLYMEQELAELSRVLFYVGIPALVLSGATILAYPTALETGGIDRSLVVTLSVTVATAPVAILFAYAIRIATVASRTPSVGSFHTSHEATVKEESGSGFDSEKR